MFRPAANAEAQTLVAPGASQGDFTHLSKGAIEKRLVHGARQLCSGAETACTARTERLLVDGADIFLQSCVAFISKVLYTPIAGEQVCLQVQTLGCVLIEQELVGPRDDETQHRQQLTFVGCIEKYFESLDKVEDVALGVKHIDTVDELLSLHIAEQQVESVVEPPNVC